MSTEKKPLTILCLSSYFKGNPFLRTCKEEGHRVILMVREKMLNEPWDRDACEEVFALPSLFDRQAMINSVTYLARSRQIDRIAALDDFDVEMAATLREHMRIPGMGATTAHYFRDKLAMRERCQARSIPVPRFVQVLNDERISSFLKEVPGPWLIKPRSSANSYGIKKFEDPDELWRTIEELGDERSFYLIEEYLPGDVCHVDGVIYEGKVLLAEAHRYRRPLMDVAKGGGIFATRTLPRDSQESLELRAAHETVVEQFGLRHGVTHMEFIRGRDDNVLYFLETAARVGGANIYDIVEASSGVNLWREYAMLEISQGETPYELPEARQDYGGLIMCLAKQEHPDLTPFSDPEVVKKIDKPYHVGLVLRSDSPDRIEELLDAYEPIIARDYVTTLPEVAPIH